MLIITHNIKLHVLLSDVLEEVLDKYVQETVNSIYRGATRSGPYSTRFGYVRAVLAIRLRLRRAVRMRLRVWPIRHKLLFGLHHHLNVQFGVHER